MDTSPKHGALNGPNATSSLFCNGLHSSIRWSNDIQLIGTDSPMHALENSLEIAVAWWMMYGTWKFSQFILWQEAQKIRTLGH